MNDPRGCGAAAATRREGRVEWVQLPAVERQPSSRATRSNAAACRRSWWRSSCSTACFRACASRRSTRCWPRARFLLVMHQQCSRRPTCRRCCVTIACVQLIDRMHKLICCERLLYTCDSRMCFCASDVRWDRQQVDCTSTSCTENEAHRYARFLLHSTVFPPSIAGIPVRKSMIRFTVYWAIHN